MNSEIPRALKQVRPSEARKTLLFGSKRRLAVLFSWDSPADPPFAPTLFMVAVTEVTQHCRTSLMYIQDVNIGDCRVLFPILLKVMI